MKSRCVSYKLEPASKLDSQTKLTDLADADQGLRHEAGPHEGGTAERAVPRQPRVQGTTDKVRQAELSYNVAQLEYEQLAAAVCQRDRK